MRANSPILLYSFTIPNVSIKNGTHTYRVVPWTQEMGYHSDLADEITLTHNPPGGN